MSKYNSNISSIYSLVSEIDKASLKPIYFLFGEDFYTLNSAIKIIQKTTASLITSDFDVEILSVEKKSNLTEILDLAYTFPFGSEKKLLVVKNFENFNNKKVLLDYIKNPSESTILVLINYGSISSLKSEPYNSLVSKNLIYEAREIKGIELQKWIGKRCKQMGFDILPDDISLLIDIVGEDKSLLDMQLLKFKSFLGEKTSINAEEIQKLASVTKEYSIFDLLNSLGKGKLEESLRVLNNLLNQNKDLVFVLSMLVKYFATIAQALELNSRNIHDLDASKILGVSKYYYTNCKNARYFMDSNRLYNAFTVLYEMDVALKSTVVDQKTMAVILITNLLTKFEKNK